MEPTLRQQIWDAIHAAMAATGVNRAELARRLKTNRAAVSHGLNGDNDFSLRTLIRIGEVLNCNWKIKLEPREGEE